MDAHLIYTVSDKLKARVTWDKVSGDSEWKFFGDKSSIRKVLIAEAIGTFLISQILYVSWKRTESMATSHQEVMKIIENILGLDDFLLWDEDFKKVIEFNKIGVFRCGRLTPP